MEIFVMAFACAALLATLGCGPMFATHGRQQMRPRSCLNKPFPSALKIQSSETSVLMGKRTNAEHVGARMYVLSALAIPFTIAHARQMRHNRRYQQMQRLAVDKQQMGARTLAAPSNNGAGLIALLLSLWYVANVGFNIVNKQALDVFPYAWTVSVIQLACVVLCSALGWVTGMLNPPSSTSRPISLVRRFTPASFFLALGNGLTSVAFACCSVSFTHVVKTSEPVWMALGNFLITGAVMPRKQVLALLPVMLGVAIASAGELSFTWFGFLAALSSTVCFALRGILSKQLMGKSASNAKEMSPLNVFALGSLIALLFTVPVAIAVEGPALVSTHGLQLVTVHTAKLLALTGLSYYAYNAIAFQLLGKLDVVSHAVGNLGKRIFVIGFSVLAFHTPVTARAAIGSLMAIMGSGLYSYVKARAALPRTATSGVSKETVGAAA